MSETLTLWYEVILISLMVGALLAVEILTSGYRRQRQSPARREMRHGWLVVGDPQPKRFAWVIRQFERPTVTIVQL